MFLHEIPEIAAGLDHLIATVPEFAGADRSSFRWRRRDPSFAGLLEMILGQQVSGAAAAAMWAKLQIALPEPKPGEFLLLEDDVLASCGFSRQKARYGRALAEALISGSLDLEALHEAPDEEVITALTALPGIGLWSAQVYLMFALGRPDIWPAGDLGIMLGVQYLRDLPDRPKPATVINAAEAWRPYRSAASLLVWNYYSSVAAARRQAAKAAALGAKAAAKNVKKPERAAGPARSRKSR
ncbi:MAG TPA: DNA-3-methyladenine glycosylase 2 family protein [Alphaproteobacteria bacterium]|nr:DNA-3-methyladenine glycosylase 2 family protein [Alphaproteobacteria bacterium]